MNQNGSIYAPLNSKKQEIRLLRILPVTNTTNNDANTLNSNSISTSELIQCHLIISPLHSHNFVALSYQWGASADSLVDILVNNQIVRVRQNLWDFLHVARSRTDDTMLLWIDTLCIDQANIEERNEHVQIMDEIYKASTMVISWLGSGDAEIETAFDVIARMWHHDDDVDTDTALGFDRLPQREQGQQYTEEEMWRILLKFCTLSYWGRVWVAQEILLPCSNYLLYGMRTLSWQAFANFCSLVEIRYRCPARYARVINNSTAKSFTAFKPYNMLPKRMEWKLGDPLQHVVSGESWNRGEYNLFRILTIFGARECTNPLDHIYALLPLTTQGMQFPVRYGIDLMTLFLTTFHFCGLATYHESNVMPGPIYEPPSQRAFMRNTRYLAETLEIVPVYQKSAPYLTNTSPMSSNVSNRSSSYDLRTPNPRADPCFPCEEQWLLLHCTAIVPGSEPPVLRSNTLRRSIENVPFDVLVHVDESSSWLMCRSEGPDQLVCIGIITLKDSPQGRGFKVLEPGMLSRSPIARQVDSNKSWKIMVAPEAHLDFLNAVILGVSIR